MHDATSPETPDALPARTARRMALTGAAVLLVIAAAGIAARQFGATEQRADVERAALPAVALVKPQPGKDAGQIVLPGVLEANNYAALYPRVDGYVRSWSADIGESVKAGQVLARIDAPEIAQALAEAKAGHRTALANQELAKTTAQRWTSMRKDGWVSAQALDEKSGDLAAKAAIAEAASASVHRLEALQRFTNIVAPFDGVVTSRSIEVGALARSSGAVDGPFYTIADVTRMRVFVQLPQSYSGAVHPGLKARMTLPEYPGETFEAVLVRSANAVDRRSGSVRIEFQAGNPKRALKPGAYAEVTIPVQNRTSTVRVPGSALIFGASGPHVAVVERGDRVRMKPVTLGRDDGQMVEIVAGLTRNEQVVDSPPEILETGDRVRVARSASAEAPAP
ncbi:efflux RND transporter periplasmic adaptor subunit [Sphingobium sp. SYK-6]|uniref:efflux RND transporter periplasmic adaptor subunit n=1 Tax=Sphingobium sp. (strain NBRC 103272 / SYK-6) TaxID=627192 RepID=UPI00059EA383|nr:efflux RND transporter periplasmic adaptor subunit [Sphingobium sp. SYK-6]